MKNIDIKEFTLAALAGLEFPCSLGEHNIYTLTIPPRYESHFSHRRQMMFTFAKEVADDYHEVEYAAQGSYLINVLTKLVIENSPIIVEYIKTHDDLAEPELQGTGRVSLQLEKQLKSYRPLYEFRLRLECASDEMLLEFFSVMIDHQGKIITQSLTELNHWPALAAPEPGININDQLLQPDFIKDLYLKAGQHVLAQVKNKIAGFERESNNRLIIGLDKLNAYRTQDNINERDKDIQMAGLRDKYSVKVNIEPAGLIIKFFPFLQSNYRLSKDGQATDLVLGYGSGLYSGRENPYICKSCGQPNRMIDICDDDQHIICDLCAQYCQKCGNTGCLQHPLPVCPICNTKICQDCRTLCADGDHFFCKEHRNQCEECSVTLCPDHVYECGVTHRRLCSTHSKKCVSCGQHYHHSYVKQCEHAGCQEYSCPQCRNQCATCGLILCKKHTLFCKTSHEYRCPQHAFRCEACGEYHGIEYQRFCGICHQTFCDQHITTCSSCKMTVCVNHTHTCAATGLILCENHAKQCGVCGEWHSNHLIQSCEECGKNLCPACLKNCVNGHSVCPDHAHTCTISAQTICRSCARKCRIHDHLVNKKLANVCSVCQSITCTEHSTQCIVCGEDACTEHSGVCGECLKNACTVHLKPCALCGRTYCTDCINRQGWCGMCDSLIKGNHPGDSGLNLLLHQIPLLDRLPAFDFRYSANRTYQVLSFQRISIHLYVFDAQGKLLFQKMLKRDDGRWRGRKNRIIF